jgi:excisionase family DNA binding protein
LNSELRALLTIKEVAEMLRVHPDTVRNLPIPFTRIGRQRRYHPRIIEKYQAAQSPRRSDWLRGTAA